MTRLKKVAASFISAAMPRIFLLSFAGILAQMALARMLDVAIYPFASHLLLSAALGFMSIGTGLTAVFHSPGLRQLSRSSGMLFAVGIVLIGPLLNLLPRAVSPGGVVPFSQAFVIFVVGMPYLFCGMYLFYLLSSQRDLGKSYASDLIGGALGAAIAPLVVRYVFPEGLLLIASASAIASTIIAGQKPRWLRLTLAITMLLSSLTQGGALEVERIEPRHWPLAVPKARVEVTAWDAVSRIDVVGPNSNDPRRSIFFDGGMQSTAIYPFDGDFRKLRRELFTAHEQHFSRLSVALVHYLRDGQRSRVFIVGPGAGQEIKAALLFNAGEVHTVDMSEAVQRVLRSNYWSSVDKVFGDPRVKLQIGDGRWALLKSPGKFDIIQIFSNYLSSSAATGLGAFQAEYLMTVGAFQDYFAKLADEGVLQVNQIGLERLISTAARAWHESGRRDFGRHLIVVREFGKYLELPTVLIKMTPWSAEDVSRVLDFFRLEHRFSIAHNPMDPNGSTLNEDFLRNGEPGYSLKQQDVFREPATDDKPFFSMQMYGGLLAMAKAWSPTSLKRVFAFIEVGFVLLLFVGASRGIQRPFRWYIMLHFMALGGGFIALEIFLIYGFMRAFSNPGLTFPAMLCGILLGGGLGSYLSTKVLPKLKGLWVTAPSLLIFGIAILTGEFYVSALRASTLVSASTAYLGAISIAFVYGIPMGFCLPAAVGRLKLTPRDIGLAFLASGVSSLLVGSVAQWLVLSHGFSSLLRLGGGLYLLAALSIAIVKWRQAEK